MAPPFGQIQYSQSTDLVERPGLRVPAPSLTEAFEIRLAIEDLKAHITGYAIYPPEDRNSDGDRIDNFLFFKASRFFIAISRLLRPFKGQDEEAILQELESLDTVERHRFFICTEPVESWLSPGVLIPGLSGLEQLLGYSYPSGASRSESAYIPSSDPDAYLLAALLLNFRNVGLELADRFPASFLQDILQDASYLSTPESERKIGSDNMEQYIPPPSNPEFDQKKDEIAEKMKKAGITIPEGF